MVYHGDKFLHIGAVTIVNNRYHTLHYAIEEEIKSRTFLINSAVGCSGAQLLLFQRAYSYIKCTKLFKLHGVYVSSVADLDRTKKRVTTWSKCN